ncbi:MAG TPA: aminoglycoside 6-adenylyltransferase, partial [Bacillota bacterium]|nr:aminoglycoside 6-adenylyltransferase [Bacillota bacterium]
MEEVLAQLVAFAEKDDNIRAMVLQGSYVNENVATDDFTDLDPLFYVKDTDAFTKTEDWKKTFGKPISTFADEDEMHDHLKWYTRLTIYDDGFKIDFGFQSVKLAMYANEMPLYRTYVDKDGIVPEPEVSDESKFYVKKPNESEFLDR